MVNRRCANLGVTRRAVDFTGQAEKLYIWEIDVGGRATKNAKISP